MTFTRHSNISNFNYTIYRSTVTRTVNLVHNFGFRLSSNLSHPTLIKDICYKALKLFGFVKIFAHHLKLSVSLAVLYFTLFRPLLEYGSVLWYPHTSGDSMLVDW